jgi:hypothetical protein
MELPRWSTTGRTFFVQASWFRLCFSIALTVTILLSFSPWSNPLAENSRGTSIRPAPIPNIVHYTMLQKDEHARLQFSFESFLSLYSALRLLKPSQIYIHTDFNDTMITNARTKGSKWTRMVLNYFPEVQLNKVSVPTHANGHRVENIEAKSDFTRWEQVYAIGGRYIDWDVIILRDDVSLREAGFKSVVGRQPEGQVNPGCFMSQKNSALTYLMKREQYKVFDNAWGTHSVDLVTSIAERLVRSPNEVLILDQAAFAPTSWEAWSVKQLFEIHEVSVPLLPQVNDLSGNPMVRYDQRSRSHDWEMDFSSTYFLHAFQRHAEEWVTGFTGVSIKYILDRKSNFALAAWPIVQMGLEEGVFSAEDDEH